ncbi:MAG TPA: hypothetical protein VEJ84_07620, partial [Acidimicrobiales bacterium]|nr:hypothetical protein [Acidimicrobiales bacterium]
APPARSVRGRADWRELLGVFVIALGLSLAWFHNTFFAPINTQAGVFGDANEYAWFLAWVPYAIGHGLNPLGTTIVNYPHGINMMWNTSILLPSFLMSPVTVIFGSAFSYNVLAVLAPVINSTFAYLAFRRWTGRLPALTGALIFGFSPFMVSQSVGHLAQTLLMSAPLLLIVLDRLLVVQASKWWVDGLLLGVLAWAQLLTGEEILALEAVVALITLIVVCAMNDRAIFSRVRYAAKGLVVGGASFGALSLPFLAYQYLGPDKVQDAHPPNTYVTDLLDFIIPTNITHFATAAAVRISSQWTGNGSEEGAYIGIPLLAFIVFTLVIARRRKITWVAFTIAASAALLSMGPTAHLGGKTTTFELPDAWLQDLPFFHNILPDRFASVMFVGVGLLVALGLNELKRFALPVKVSGWAVACLGLVALIPITNFPSATSPLYSAFATGFACPATTTPASASPRPVALVLPTINEMSLRWQSEARFCFAMPSDTGMTGTNPGDLGQLPLVLTIGQPGQNLPGLTPGVRADMAEEMKALDVSEIIVTPQYPFSGLPPWTPNNQAQLIAWLEGLLGQAPAQSHDPYVTYVWWHLPSFSNIASGQVPAIHGAL